MKRSNSFVLVAILLFSTAFLESQAQLAMNGSRGSSAGKVLIPKGPNEGARNNTNVKAVKKFSKAYADAVEANWAALSDKSLVCRFLRNKIPCMAFYTAKGQWTATVSTYDAARLDKDVYDEVKKVYYNSTLGSVNQVDLAGGKTYYIVEVEDAKTIKKIRVDNDGMEVVKELDKM